MRYQNILVLGGTGFLGRSVVDRLAAEGRRVRVATRRLTQARELAVLPTVEIVEADIHDPAALDRLLAGCDAVVNLVGILHDPGTQHPYGRWFCAVHVELPRRLTAACKARGIGRLLHVSALGADGNGPSAYLRSKGDGEDIVRSAGPAGTTIFRPSVVFGDGDRFLNRFAGLAACLPVLLLGRPDARLQPVWVEDVAAAIDNALDAQETFGKTYELCGPTVYSLRRLVQFAARASGHSRPVIGLPDFLAYLLADALALLPGEPPLTRDNLDSLSVDNVASTQPYRPAPELGIRPAPMEPEAALYLAGLHPRTRMDGFRAQARHG